MSIGGMNVFTPEEDLKMAEALEQLMERRFARLAISGAQSATAEAVESVPFPGNNGEIK